MPSESGGLRKQETVDLVVRGEKQNKNHAKSQKRRNSESNSRQVRLHQPFQRRPTSADVVVVGQSWRHNTQENQAQGGRMHFSVVVRSFSPYVVDLAVLEACVEAEISQEEGVVGKRYLLYSGQGGKDRARTTQRDRDRQREKETEKERHSLPPTRPRLLQFHQCPLVCLVVGSSEVTLKSYPCDPIPSAFFCT